MTQQVTIIVLVALSLIIGVGLTFALLKIRILKQMLIHQKVQTLTAQINDHFIGNSMDSIYAYLDENNPQEAQKYLAKFNRVIRNTLRSTLHEYIPLREDLDILRDYVDLERLRFKGNNLNLDVLIDKKINIDNVLVKPLLIQIFAENAIKHGFHKQRGGIIIVNIKSYKDNFLKCTVQDNGGGIKIKSFDQKEGSYGISMAQRLITSFLKSKHAMIEITDLTDSNTNTIGTKVEFLMPCIMKKQN